MDIAIRDFQFSIDFNKTTKREEIHRLQASMEKFFATRSYSQMVEVMHLDLFCLPFYYKPYKRPKYYEDLPLKLSSGEIVEHLRFFLRISITIENAEEYLNSNEVDGYRIVERSIIEYFHNNPLPVKIRKSFDTDAFLDDMKMFFDEYIKTLENHGAGSSDYFQYI